MATRVIDLLHLGRERVIGCWQVDDVLVDPGPGSCLPTLLEALGDQRPRALLLTHIHLDHAGASGSLVRRWPELEVYVHERGAPHLVDPTRLLDSARRLYGDDMDRLWGEFEPVPESQPAGAARRRAVARRGVRGRLHARPRLAPRLLPARGHRIRRRRRRRSDHALDAGHPADAAARHRHRGLARVDRAHRRLAAAAARDDALRRQRRRRRSARRARAPPRCLGGARARPRPGCVHRRRARPSSSGLPPDIRASYLQAVPPDQVYAGLERYWRRRAEREAG